MPPAVLPLLASREKSLRRKSFPWMKPGFFSLFPFGLLLSLVTFLECSFSRLLFSSPRLLLVVAICCICTSESSATSVEIQVDELLREIPHHSSPFPAFSFCAKNTLAVSPRSQRSLFCFSSLSFAEKTAEWTRCLPINLGLGGSNNGESRPLSLSRKKETSAVPVGTGWRGGPEGVSHLLRLSPRGFFRKHTSAYLTSRFYPPTQSPGLHPLGLYDYREYKKLTRMPGAAQRYVHSSFYLPLQTASPRFLSLPRERKTKSSAICSLFGPVTQSRRRVASCVTERTPTDSFAKTEEAPSAAAGRNGLEDALFRRGQGGPRTGMNPLLRLMESSSSFTALWGAGKGRAQQKKGPTRAGASRPKGTDKKNAPLKKGSKAGEEKKKKGEEKLRIPLRRTTKGSRQRQEDLFSELTKDNLDGRDLPHGLVSRQHDCLVMSIHSERCSRPLRYGCILCF